MDVDVARAALAAGIVLCAAACGRLASTASEPGDAAAIPTDGAPPARIGAEDAGSIGRAFDGWAIAPRTPHDLGCTFGVRTAGLDAITPPLAWTYDADGRRAPSGDLTIVHASARLVVASVGDPRAPLRTLAAFDRASGAPVAAWRAYGCWLDARAVDDRVALIVSSRLVDVEGWRGVLVGVGDPRTLRPSWIDDPDLRGTITMQGASDEVVVYADEGRLRAWRRGEAAARPLGTSGAFAGVVGPIVYLEGTRGHPDGLLGVDPSSGATIVREVAGAHLGGACADGDGLVWYEAPRDADELDVWRSPTRDPNDPRAARVASVAATAPPPVGWAACGAGIYALGVVPPIAVRLADGATRPFSDAAIPIAPAERDVVAGVIPRFGPPIDGADVRDFPIPW